MQRALRPSLLMATFCLLSVPAFADEAQLVPLREAVLAKQIEFDRLSQLVRSNTASQQEVRKAHAELLEAKLQVAIASGDSASVKTLQAAQCINAKRQLEGIRRLMEQNAATETDLYQAEIALRALEVKYYTTIGMASEAKASLQAAIASTEKELAKSKSLTTNGSTSSDVVTSLEQQLAALKQQLQALKN